MDDKDDCPEFRELSGLPLLDILSVALAVDPSVTPEITESWRNSVEWMTRVVAANKHLLAASAEVRKYYPPYHADCHFRRVKKFIEMGCKWTEHTGPNDPEYRASVALAAAQRTLH